MAKPFHIIDEWQLSKVDQVAAAVKREIESKRLKKDAQLPSINEFSKTYNFARDTVEKAYKILKKEGYITSVGGKGYFVLEPPEVKMKVLLVMNKLSAFKKDVYNSLIKTLGENAAVDLKIHHYSLKYLKEIIDSSLGKYNYYILMPHFHYDAAPDSIMKILRTIPDNQLIILDKKIKGLKRKCAEVYQDFKNDIYQALHSQQKLIKKYKKIIIVLRKEEYHPEEIIDGVKKICAETGKKFEVLNGAEDITLEKKTLYIDTSEQDLAFLMKKARHQQLTPGKEVGIISFNETVLKELLDVTVITTDFIEMGRIVADCILQQKSDTVKVPFYFIKRSTA
ncbi:MAG: winged helix-turn-helix domain-containing protein [Niabella sp.]